MRFQSHLPLVQHLRELPGIAFDFADEIHRHLQHRIHIAIAGRKDYLMNRQRQLYEPGSALAPSDTDLT